MPADVFDQMWEVLQALGRDINAAAAEVELTPMQALLLDRLDDDAATPQTELARRMHCDASNLISLVDALEAKHLIERTTPPTDRRIRAIVATDAGHAVRRQLHDRLRIHNPLLGRLSATETSQLSRLLARVLQG